MLFADVSLGEGCATICNASLAPQFAALHEFFFWPETEVPRRVCLVGYTEKRT